MPLVSGVTLNVACADDRLVAEILGGEEYELLFAEVNGHGALLRFEPPRQIRRDVAVERNRHSLIGGGSRVGIRPLRRPSISSCATEGAVQLRSIGHQAGHEAKHDEAEHENLQVFPVAQLHFSIPHASRPRAPAMI